MPDSASIRPTPGIRMIFLIRRKPSTSREELIAYWFAHHMPLTIKVMGDVGTGYIGTIFDDDGGLPWDGYAQMFLDEPLETPEAGHGAKPADSFHERIEPYYGWATHEYVFIDGSAHLPVRPLTLNPPFPTSRSGFFKVTYLMTARPGVDHDEMAEYWLTEHARNVTEAMGKADGFGYRAGLSVDPARAPYAGMTELYFKDRAGWERYHSSLHEDGMGQWIDDDQTQRYFAQTEFVAIP